ncbi:hypothetical protein ACTS9T_08725 [Empedobacter falsenii]
MKKTLLKLTFATALLFSTIAFGQTADELKAEREMIKKELKSEKAIERQKKLQKLEVPKSSSIKSIDELAVNSGVLLVATKQLNEQVPELYKRTIGETVDGVTEVTTDKPTLEELEDVAKTILVQIQTVSDYSSIATNVAGDVKSANPLSAGKALKSINFSKDVLSLTLPELNNNLVVIKNLISTIKSSNNL